MTGNYRRPVVTVNCKTCGIAFEVEAYKARKHPDLFCTRECYYRSPHRRDFFTCVQCGKEFSVPKGIVAEHRRSGKPPPRFCGNACHNLARENKVLCVCGTCGKEFQTIPSEIRKGGGKFCSRPCFDIYRRTSNEYFRQLRKKASCKPNGVETALLAMFPDDLLFTGDGELWVDMPDGRHRNPDFKVKGQKKLIEVFGSPFHRPEEEPTTIADYRAVGWECLVVWARSLSSEPKRAKLRPIVQSFIQS